MILAGDIGGTHTRLALFEEKGGPPLHEKKYLSRNYKGLGSIVSDFLEKKGKVSRGCFGVAGAVHEGRCRTTNLPWVVDIGQLGRELHISSIHLMNDLEANAHGLKELEPQELYCLQKGIQQSGNQALISAGTGLGEAGLFWDGKKHHPFASEGGHTDFAPRNPIEMELLSYLRASFDHVSYERVVSGPGLYALYRFLIDTKREKMNPEVEKRLKQEDPPSVIATFGIAGSDSASQRAVEWFVSLYGAEAGNVALKFLSRNGLYIGGGIAPHLLETLKQGAFVKAFCNKGRFHPLLESIPIYVVLNDNAALLGAASFARQL